MDLLRLHSSDPLPADDDDGLADLAGEIEDALEAPKAEVLLELPPRRVALDGVEANLLTIGRIGNGKIYVRAEFAGPALYGCLFHAVPEDYPEGRLAPMVSLDGGKIVLCDGERWMEFEAPEVL